MQKVARPIFILCRLSGKLLCTFLHRNKLPSALGLCPKRGWVGWWMSTWGFGLLRFPKIPTPGALTSRV